jgi:AcrR family transcriptional regulator
MDHTAREPNPGRRNAAAHRAILDATVALLERDGYKRLTIEAIAARAGVGKQTIYRWWPSKASLVMEAYAAAGEERVPEPDTGTVSGDLAAILIPVFAINGDFASGGALANRSMMAEALLDAEFLATYRRLHASWRGPLVHVLERGKARGEVRPAVDVEALVDIILGASWYRQLLAHAPLDERYARQIIAAVIDGAGIGAD